MFRKYWCLIIVVVLSIAIGCSYGNGKASHAFYYWRSNFVLSDKDISYLEDAGVHKLYLHFFDVTWNELQDKVLPVDEIRFETGPIDKFQYVPVVYIANKAFEQTSTDSIVPLARRIFDEVEHIAVSHAMGYKELQFDCDWTDATREKYFKLLSFLHDGFKKSGKEISATIRLHQVKYADKTGVPPVDRGMLMFYNIGRVNSMPGYNSIYNDKDADKYASYISSYALPLDLALPVFSWAVCIRTGRVASIIEKVANIDFADTAMFISAGKNIFVSNRSFFFRGKYFMKNDTVKIEQVTPAICKNAVANAGRYMKNDSRTLSLFDYDPLYLTTYEKKDILEIFDFPN